VRQIWSFEQIWRAFECCFIDAQRQNDRHRYSQYKLQQADNHGVGEQLGEIERIEKRDKVFKPGEWAIPDPQQRLEILECNLCVPQRQIAEQQKIDQPWEHHNIQPAIFV
jgi:hypothetical protein